ncbi:MAG: hypothetical protein KJ061_01360 [Vicinamibacteraceae bacterium]|nr:hypothetical protein [Vicinamibacteraceae bacterium]
MNAGVIIQPRDVPVFEFEDLGALPCGCVTAEFRSARWGVTLVSVEAKGPYCSHEAHFVGQVLSLADDYDDEDEGEEFALRIQG